MRKPRNPIQSFKKVYNLAPASRAGATKLEFIAVEGKDSVAAGQTSPTDMDVPTGSVITGIEFQYSVSNLVSVASFLHVSVQHLRSGQTSIASNVIGGNPQRNQVFFQRLYSVGKDQNRDIIIKFKIPKKFQRVREGDKWVLVTENNQIFTDCVQMVYKFYR